MSNGYVNDGYVDDGYLGYGGGSTSAVVYLSLRTIAGQFSSTGVSPKKNTRNLKTLLPHRSVKVFNDDGTYTDVWYRFFDYFANTFSNLPSGIGVGDVVDSVEESQDNAAAAAASAAAVAQQATANAQSLGSAIEVLKAANVPGATQIPPPQYAPAETNRPSRPTNSQEL